MKTQDHDPVNHPSHYTQGLFEVIDVIEDWGLGFHLGNTVKYIARAGKKDPSKTIEDLEKARWYLDRCILSFKAEASDHVLEPAKYDSETKQTNYCRSCYQYVNHCKCSPGPDTVVNGR